MVNELERSAMMAQANALEIMSKSAMPQEEQQNLIDTLSNLLGLSLNVAQSAYKLSDDESMSLLTLIMIKVTEIVEVVEGKW